MTPEEKLLKIIKNKEAKQKFIPKFSIKITANKILICGIIILLGYLIFWITISRHSRPRLHHSRINSSGNPEVISSTRSPIKTFGDDTLEAKEIVLDKEKDIFDSQIDSEENAIEQIDAGFQDRVLQQFVLVGVMGQSEAIIEDKNNNKTYFLHKNDKLMEFKVKDINSEKVILEANGQEVELVL